MTKRRRIWTIVGGIAAVVLITTAIVATYIANNFEPVIRTRIIQELEQRFDSQVQLEKLNISAIPRLHVVGKGLTLKMNRYPDLPPILQADEFSFRVEWQDLTTPRRHISLVRLKGLQLNMPPRGKPSAQPGNPPPSSPPPAAAEAPKEESSAPEIIVDQIVADKTMLRLWPREANKPPKEFELIGLRILGAGPGRPLSYSTKMTNYKPPGLIDSMGQFGPWHKDLPSETPLSGNYTFTKADLGVFKGIAGTLNSAGKFNGILGRIEVDGETQTPDFQIRMAQHKVPLTTKFHAIVDGTDGDTYLEPVEAKILNTTMTVRGKVEGVKGEKGKNIVLDVVMPSGRLEDLMQLAVKGRPAMRGAVTLKTKLDIPRGNVDVIEKLGLDGNFVITNARFVNQDIQGKIDGFSRRASGRPGDKEIENVRSTITGTFLLKDTLLHMPKMKFATEGAEVEARGEYGLRSEKMDFDGVLRMDAKASQAFQGMKSILLKPFDPLVSRKDHGTVLSIKIEGTREHPKFGLDIKRTLKKKDK
jgi:hypothetical protein